VTVFAEVTIDQHWMRPRPPELLRVWAIAEGRKAAEAVDEYLRV
jgi:NADPH-dependent glutamate synthase beta subunit-like oxidoreductase